MGQDRALLLHAVHGLNADIWGRGRGLALTPFLTTGRQSPSLQHRFQAGSGGGEGMGVSVQPALRRKMGERGLAGPGPDEQLLGGSLKSADLQEAAPRRGA